MGTTDWFREAERRLRTSMDDIGGGDLRRLFDRDAAQAYGVVTRGYDRTDEPLYDDCSLVVLRREPTTG